MKRPSFQFYPADWKNNSKLRRCSEAARGAWIDILCLLHDSDEYGVVRWPLVDLARAAGVSLKSAKELAEKGVLKGSDGAHDAFYYTPRKGNRDGEPVMLIGASDGPCWYCSRFLRDEEVKNRRSAGGELGKEFGQLGAKHGSKGGRPKGGRGVLDPPSNPPPSSSTSSSTSLDTPLPPLDEIEVKPLCTLEAARDYAPMVRMSLQAADAWWHNRNAIGWRRGGAGSPRIISWQSDMANSRQWAEEAAAKAAAVTPGGSEWRPRFPGEKPPKP